MLNNDYRKLMQRCNSLEEFKLQMTILDPKTDLQEYEKDYLLECSKFAKFFLGEGLDEFTFEKFFSMYKPQNIPVIVKFESDSVDPDTFTSTLEITYIGKTSLKEMHFSVNLEIFESIYQLHGVDMKSEILNVFKYEYDRS